jgi:cation transport ATPase
VKKSDKMKKKFLLLVSILNFFVTFAFAFCPVCTVVVAGGVGLSRWLKVDDLISGLWIGGLLFSLSLWTINWLDKKKIKFLFRKILVFIFWYLIVILPFYRAGIIGDLRNRILGIDKLIIGIILGSIIFPLSLSFNDYLVKKNNDKIYFPFQKIVFSVLFLLISSLVLFLILNF